ncbi:hypothetical protein [Oceanibaculum nanhaiense]|uniref:hypothetical protein n=1 Tax=Oceanibaculum nanhaiense TaxID=1909734 RepID=UPI000A3BFFE8|nr:hypothetical protein [Oceanibaculum nanhaiense]|tara:strand:+ start:831 stop:1142 length:312 start_codon:yes stop_codon:yes gene_type:complete
MIAFTKNAFPALLIAGFVGLGFTSANAANFSGASDGGPAVSVSGNPQAAAQPQITLVDRGNGLSDAGPVAVIRYGEGRSYASTRITDAPRNAPVALEEIDVKN